MHCNTYVFLYKDRSVKNGEGQLMSTFAHWWCFFKCFCIVQLINLKLFGVLYMLEMTRGFRPSAWVLTRQITRYSPLRTYVYISVSYIKVKQSHYRSGQARGSRSLKLPDIKTIGTRKWKGCQPYAPVAFTPGYSFLLETELTPGSKCSRKNSVNVKFQWHTRESNPQLSGL
jgi:hypothetical protein